MMLMIALTMIQAAPSAEAAELGKRVAESGALVRMLPMIATKEGEELVKDHPELTAAEHAELRRTAVTTADGARAKLVAASGADYATKLSESDMRAIVAFEATPAAKARREADMGATMAAVSALGSFDFKKEVMAAFCAKTGKGCAK